MSADLPAHFLRLHDYERWATPRTLDALDTIPEPARSSPQAVRAAQVMAHVQLARRVWLARLNDRVERPADWFPAWPLPELRAAAAEIDRAWGDYLRVLTPTALAQTFEYASSDGQRFSNTVHDVLTHVFNHSTYHRGQVARLVHECGGQRPSTDFIFFARTPL